MPPLPMSPRLPGVFILAQEATGPQYRRWRRGVESAFSEKGTWGHCDGSIPMPMPTRVASNFFTENSEPQPGLLEERKAWVKKDRDVKLDIFLSISDDIKMDVFEVGPPLPPSAMTAMEMIEALDERFQIFRFEDYHHVWCHFLNLHIDQYPSLDEFNLEFMATLEDMEDHGFPLHNLQACSAYFSKLRCTQNPWVAKKLKEWDSLSPRPQIKDIVKQVPPWIVIRPLAYKNIPPSTNSPPMLTDSHSETLMSNQSSSEVATLSSQSSQEEITIHASAEDLTDAFLVPGIKPTTLPVPQRLSSKTSTTQPRKPLPPLPPAGTVEMPAELAAEPSLRPVELPAESLPPRSIPMSSPMKPSSPTRSRKLQVPASPNPSILKGSSIGENIRRSPKSTSLSPFPSVQASPASPTLHLHPPSPSSQEKRPSSAPRLPSLSATPDFLSQFPPAPKSPLDAKPSVETFHTWPLTRPGLQGQDSADSSTMSLPLQGIFEMEYTPGTPRSPKSPKSPVSLGSPGKEKVEREVKKKSWSIKSRFSSRRLEIQEII